MLSKINLLKTKWPQASILNLIQIQYFMNKRNSKFH